MNRSKVTIFTLLQALSIVAIVTFFSQTSLQAQGTQESKSVSISTAADGKVQLKVIIKKGNDETTFEKSYDSYDDMYNDPHLEEYGIDLGWQAQGFGSTQRPKFFLHSGPGGQFWDDDAFQSEMESLRQRMQEMMRGFGDRNFFFDFDDQHFMDMDSLMQRFQFKNDNGKFFFNGEEITDLDSLQEALRDKFGNFQFGFDGWDEEDFGFWTNREDEKVKVIQRAKAYVRTAREEDKQLVGTDQMEALSLNDISFYPNPSDGRFDIELSTENESPIQMIIVDEKGNEIYNKVKTPNGGYLEQGIDLTTEGKGTFVLKLIQNGKALTKRIVVE